MTTGGMTCRPSFGRQVNLPPSFSQPSLFQREANSKQHREIGKRKTIVIIAEGAHDRHGNKITPEQVKDLLADKSGLALDTRITTLGHVQRGGTAVAYDRMLATLQGVEAVRAVLEATPETETCFIAITENKIVRKPLMQAVKDTREVATAIENKRYDEASGAPRHRICGSVRVLHDVYQG